MLQSCRQCFFGVVSLVLEHPFSAASGQLGDLIHSRNRSGQYTRPYVLPIGSDTPAAQVTAAAFATVAAYWTTTLTEDDRQAWQLWADTHPRPDALGQLRHLTGRMAWIGVSLQRLQAGAPFIFRPSALGTLVRLTPPLIELVDVTHVRVTVTTTDAWASFRGGFLTISMSPAVSAGINFYAGPFRRIGSMVRGLFGLTNPQTFTLTDPVPIDGHFFFRLVTQTNGGVQTPPQVTSIFGPG